MRRQFGEISGVPPGSTFEHRMELSRAGVHRPPQGGICGTAKFGAESVVLSGGYPEDDFGDEIIYTGEGGWDRKYGIQRVPQELTGGNAALQTSFQSQQPVRVVRGSGAKSPYSPAIGYRYDGLFSVVEVNETTRDGLRIYKFRLKKVR